jgi:hypothetical protein
VYFAGRLIYGIQSDVFVQFTNAIVQVPDTTETEPMIRTLTYRNLLTAGLRDLGLTRPQHNLRLYLGEIYGPLSIDEGSFNDGDFVTVCTYLLFKSTCLAAVMNNTRIDGYDLEDIFRSIRTIGTYITYSQEHPDLFTEESIAAFGGMVILRLPSGVTAVFLRTPSNPGGLPHLRDELVHLLERGDKNRAAGGGRRRRQTRHRGNRSLRQKGRRYRTTKRSGIKLRRTRKRHPLKI